MGSCWAENPLTKREQAIKGLVQGQECATQLQNLLREPFGEKEYVLSELAEKILTSFNETLSVLSAVPSAARESAGQSNGRNLFVGSQIVNSGCSDDRSQDSCLTSRKIPTSAKDRRGCYKRKKALPSWSIVSPTTDDGQAWRKYGQKEILNSKFPRSYFRCTRKYDQGCKATKQVQKTEDPQMYHITYIGQHTCKDILGDPQRISASFFNPRESHGAPTCGQDLQHPFTQTSPLPFPNNVNVVIKQELKELEAPLDPTDIVSTQDESNNLWKDLVPFCSFGDELKPPMVYYTPSEQLCRESLDMDLIVSSFDFNGDFQFNETEPLIVD